MEKNIAVTHYFLIADVHLETMDDQQAFFDMLSAVEQFPQDHAIVFLGDIFDLWFSLWNHEEALQSRFLDWCTRVGQKRKILFVEGNHEFYVQRKYRHHDFQVQSRYVIHDHLKFIHGDLINTSDYPYFILRFLLRNPLTMLLLNLFGKTGMKYWNVCNVRLRSINKKHKKHLPDKHIQYYLQSEAQKGISRIFAGHFHVRATYSDSVSNAVLEIIPAFYSHQEIGLYDVENDSLKVVPWQSFVSGNKN